MPIFIKKINDITRLGYTVLNCPNKISNDNNFSETKYTCGRSLLPLLCMENISYVPRIIIFDMVSSTDDSVE